MANARMRAAAYGYRSTEDFYTSMAEAIKEARQAYALDSTNRGRRVRGGASRAILRARRATR